MSIVCRGITHCAKCMSPLGDDMICHSCENKKKFEEIKEKTRKKWEKYIKDMNCTKQLLMER